MSSHKRTYELDELALVWRSNAERCKAKAAKLFEEAKGVPGDHSFMVVMNKGQPPEWAGSHDPNEKQKQVDFISNRVREKEHAAIKEHQEFKIWERRAAMAESGYFPAGDSEMSDHEFMRDHGRAHVEFLEAGRTKSTGENPRRHPSLGWGPM